MNLAATGEYFDLYRAADVAKRVDNLSNFLTNEAISDFTLNKQREQLNNQIRILEQKEQVLFEKLNVKSIEELNQRLKNYQQETLNLSGPALYKEFIFTLENENIKSYDTFEKAVYEVINSLIKENTQKASQKYGDYIHSLVMTELNKNTTKSHFYSTKGYDIGSGQNELSEIVKPIYFTKEQTKQLMEIMKTKYAKKDFPQVLKCVTQETNNGQKIETWFDYTGRATSKKANNAQRRAETSQAIKNLILSKNPQASPLLSEIIDYVLSESKNKAFYVGHNEKEIIGILGEIQALYFLCSLTNTKPGDTVQWRGGIIDDTTGKKPHQDIVLESLGIQVKNTTKDLQNNINQDINFWNLNINEFLKRLELSPSIQEMFLNYFGTYQFNIPYIKTETGDYQRAEKAIGEGSEIFNPAREELIGLQSDIDKLFSVFAASLMYMDISQDIKNVDANILYILGGTAAITASQILHKIRQDLQKSSTPIMINSYLKEQGANIVGVLNQVNLFRQKEQQTKSISTNILNNIKLSARYRFNLANYF